MAEIKVIHSPSEKYPFAVIFKPAGLPSAPLKEGEDSALTRAVSLFPQIKNVEGKKQIEYGLLHRIDTATQGLLLIACTQEFFDYLIEEQKNKRFTKFYTAEVENPLNIKKTFTVTSRFRPFGEKGRLVRPVFENSSTADKKKCTDKLYSTDIRINGKSAFCSIKEGYRHQVRAHLSYSGFPIKGDLLYNQNAVSGEDFKFTACGFEFFMKDTGEKLSFEFKP